MSLGPTRRGKGTKVMAICDRGSDSDGLDNLLMKQYGIQMIAANRQGRVKTQDGRPLRWAELSC